ncbi:MAG: DUF362 domain-containing protein [Candidatus Hodarchaeota archaeon]
MENSLVYGIHQDDESEIGSAIETCLKAIEVDEIIKEARYIILKPNYVTDENYCKGNVTNPNLLEAVIEYIKAINENTRLAIGEGGETSSTKRAFDMNQLPELCKRQGIKLIDFNHDDTETIEIEGAMSLTKPIKVAKNSLECDLLISIPSLKTHSMAVTTLSLKNFMGTLSRKSIMHSNLKKKIVDLYSFFKPKAKFAIIDGCPYGSEGFECGGNPIKHDIILASKDLVALDTVGTCAMGIDPANVGYLQVAGGRGFGNNTMDNIVVKGIDINKHVIKYR